MRGGGGSHWGVPAQEGQFHAFNILRRGGKKGAEGNRFHAAQSAD